MNLFSLMSAASNDEAVGKKIADLMEVGGKVDTLSQKIEEMQQAINEIAIAIERVETML